MSEIFSSNSVTLTFDHNLSVLINSYCVLIFSPLPVTYLFLNRVDVIIYHFPTLLKTFTSFNYSSSPTAMLPNFNLLSVPVSLKKILRSLKKIPQPCCLVPLPTHGLWPWRGSRKALVIILLNIPLSFPQKHTFKSCPFSSGLFFTSLRFSLEKLKAGHKPSRTCYTATSHLIYIQPQSSGAVGDDGVGWGDLSVPPSPLSPLESKSTRQLSPCFQGSLRSGFLRDHRLLIIFCG